MATKVKPLAKLSRPALEALVKLSITKKVLIPSTDNRGSYETLVFAGYAYQTGDGFMLRLDEPEYGRIRKL